MEKKHECRLTISRNSNDVVCVSVVDDSSGLRFLELELTLEAYALAISGLSMVGCIGTYRRMSDAGKLRVVERRSIACPIDTYDREVMSAWLLENAQEQGWEINPYLGSQASVTNTNGVKTLNYSVFKYVEQP